jgi:hypothetical protein
MTRKSVKHVSQGKGHALPRSSAGGLTCSEGQVDDVLSAGESTEEERALPTETHPLRPNIPVRL